MLIIPATKRLLSKSKQNDPKQLKEYLNRAGFFNHKVKYYYGETITLVHRHFTLSKNHWKLISKCNHLKEIKKGKMVGREGLKELKKGNMVGKEGLGEKQHQCHINTLITCEKKQYESLVTAIPALSLNNNTLNQRKNLRRLLEDSPLKEKKAVVRHDVVNNTISSHRTNNYRPAGVEELTNYLKSKKQQISAIVYCRRE